MAGKPAPTTLAIDDEISKRWSARAIDSSKPVEPAKIERMLEAARWAASCFNDQPWRYLVWNKHQDQDTWDEAMGTLAEKNQLWARSAPILMLSCANESFSHNGKPNRHAQYDTGSATHNLHIQGVAEGLVVHQMAGFDKNAAKEKFGIPDGVTPMAMIAVGYPGTLADLDEQFHEGENADRVRKPQTEFVFANRWPVE